MIRRLARIAGGTLVLALLATGASGFVRSRDPGTRACLWWRDRLVPIHLNATCSVDVPIQNCENAVWTTLDAWNQAYCSDFSFISAGTTDRTDIGFDEDNWNDNINLILWQEGAWAYDRSAIALTTTTYDRLTGEIVDTDIEFNGVDYTFTTAESAETLTDIANTLAHEAGHMLGLDHSTNSDASMYGIAAPGETKKRDLSQDDIDGVCHIYPIGQDLPPCEGFVPPKKKGGCDCTVSNATGKGLALLAFGLLLVLLRARRSKEA